jgi:hypothetical protein
VSIPGTGFTVFSHGLSHHLFPNTYNDFEISALEPFLFFLPDPDKNRFFRFAVQVYAHVRNYYILYN